jgi:DNA modification methylase
VADPQVVMMPVTKLRASNRNARTHSKKQIRQIADSIRQFGWTCPILVDEDGIIIAGHGRFAASADLGLKRLPTILVSGLNDVEKRALALADNKIADNAGVDRILLATELGELASLLPGINLDISITGFEPAEIDMLMGDLIDPEQDSADVQPPIVEHQQTTRRSDLWLLGAHRLQCGDARDETDLRCLMEKDRAAMIFTDPPYNVRIDSVQGRGKIKHREFAHASGEMSREQFRGFLAATLSHAANYSVDGSLHFVCMDWRHIGELLDAGRPIYSEVKNICVWVKTNAGQGSLYRSQHEMIVVFKNGDAGHQNNVELGRHGRNRSNVWTYAGVNTFRAGRLDDLSIHPTVKPIALVADAMRDCTRRDDLVLDLFMGSGTTILAAEKIGRRAYGLEIDPAYVDAAIRRWQTFTGRDATLYATGQTFGEVAQARAARRRVRITK